MLLNVSSALAMACKLHVLGRRVQRCVCMSFISLPRYKTDHFKSSADSQRSARKAPSVCALLNLGNVAAVPCVCVGALIHATLIELLSAATAAALVVMSCHMDQLISGNADK